MGKNGFVKVRVTKDSEGLIPVRHPSSFAMPLVVTVCATNMVPVLLVRQ